ncbi:MAG: Hsp20/alpha crystallin family protein [Nitrososphaerales archaeon]
MKKNTTEKNAKQKTPAQGRGEPTELALPGLGLPQIFQDYMRPFDELMGQFSFPGAAGSPWTALAGKEQNVDVQDRGDHFLLTAELPGFEKKDIEVRVSSNVVELKAERKTESRNKGTGGGRTERSYSYFQRYTTLPEQVVSEKVDGTMKNGILELKLPKAEPKPKDSSRRVHLN